MSSPADRKYTTSHEWIQLAGETGTLGLTRFAVEQLTDVTFVEMKKAGTAFKAGESIGEVESVKTTSDVYAPVDGVISEVNKAAVDDPSLLNTDPFGKGWLVKIKVSSPGALAKCVDAAAYDRDMAH